MTAQIQDIILYNGERFDLVDTENRLGFDPQAYGIIPEGRISSCWNGFFCMYEIIDEVLFLRQLNITSKDDNYPLIEGKYAEADGHFFAYKNLDIRIPFSGKLLLGKGFISDFYIHAGRQRAWAYQKLTELFLKNGVLVDCVDKSRLAELLRERLLESDVSKSKFFLEIEAEIFEIAEKEGIREWWLPEINKKFVQLLMQKSTL